MNSRKAAREAITAFLASGIPTLNGAVFDFEVLDSGGLSPYATVHSDGTATGPGETLDADHRMHGLFITLYWRRTEEAEDGLDDLSEDVMDLIEANDELPGVWGSLQRDSAFSQMDYTTPEDGVIYRFERIRVIVW